MSESYTPQELIDEINSKRNPNGPPYDPAKTEFLREASRIKKATQGDIIAQAKLQNGEAQRQEAKIEAKIAQAEKVIADMREWLIQDGTYYSTNYIDDMLSELTVEYDNDTDRVITSGTLNLYSLTSAEGLTLPQSVGGNLDLGSLTSAEGLTLPESIGGGLYLSNLRSAEGLTLPQSVGGSLSLRSLTSAKGLILPQSVGGDLSLFHLRSAEGLTLPQSVGGGLDLSQLRSAEGLTLPQGVGGSLYLNYLTSAEGLTLPESVGGDIYLESLTHEGKQKLRELQPDLADKIVGI